MFSFLWESRILGWGMLWQGISPGESVHSLTTKTNWSQVIQVMMWEMVSDSEIFSHVACTQHHTPVKGLANARTLFGSHQIVPDRLENKMHTLRSQARVSRLTVSNRLRDSQSCSERPYAEPLVWYTKCVQWDFNKTTIFPSVRAYSSAIDVICLFCRLWSCRMSSYTMAG